MAITISKSGNFTKSEDLIIMFPGSVISTFNGDKSVQYMSDVWDTWYFTEVQFWNEDTKSVENRQFNQCDVTVVVDATPEILQKAEDFYKAKREKAEADRLAQIKYNDEQAAKAPAWRKTVKVVGGRKYLEVKGDVFWTGPNKFRSGGMIAGIKVDNMEDEKIFVPFEYLEVIDWEQYMPGAPKKPLVIKLKSK